ncbi:MAG: phenylalanyl-tRNA synthetase beta chain [Candidatus Nanohaloarchaea archaeon]|jgi:phenylalanyl-tRNA synthetase beta chain
MPTLKINKEEFEDLLGEEISEEQLHEEASYLGAHWNHEDGKKWEVETYPNRPDLLSVEGLARAYKGFFDVETGLRDYRTRQGITEVNVDESVEQVRPYIGGAVIRDVELTPRIINGLIQLQEKLHQTVGRRRDKIAIGLHDLDSVEPPFTYKAVEPEQVSFTPLEYGEEIHLEEILNEHDKGQEYAWILEDEEKFPIISDSDGKILSFPPIINNQLTEVTSETTDIFIDVTGKHKETVLKVVNILVTALAERDGKIETVRIDNDHMPLLEPEEVELDVEYFRSVSGLELEKEEIVDRLEQMRFKAKKKKDKIKVGVPSYRTDVMHQYDIIEDIVIAHRYNNIEPEMPELDTPANEKQIEEHTEELRDILQGTGALESHTFTLSSKEKLFDRMNRKAEDEVVEMSNALTEDYTVVRNQMLPTMMEVLQNNRQHSYPQRFYEIEDVALPRENDAENRRKLAYAISGPETDFTDIKQVLQVIERDTGFDLEVEEAEKRFYREDRAAKIIYKGETVGHIGELGEEVLANWELEQRTAALELDVEKLYQN